MRAMGILHVLTIGLCLFTFRNAYASTLKRVCYYTNWSQYRPGIGRFVPQNIDPTLCTHVIFAFAKLTRTGELTTLEWNDEQMYQQINGLKSINPGLKTLIAVGGWNAASAHFTTMVSSKTSRQHFIQSTLAFLRRYNFDGIDLDWEYPTKRGGKPADKLNFELLLKELKEAFMQEARRTGRARYLLTAAVPAGKPNIDSGYNVGAIAKDLDFINVMTYDLHGAWEKTTGENSPLFPKGLEKGGSRQLNLAWAANYWVAKGAPKAKLVIGMATYGRSFTLANQNNYGIGAPATGAGNAGKFTREGGILAYYEICQMQDTKLGQSFWDTEQRVPYYVKDNQWVGYDNEKSIFEKATWVKNEGFAGAMIWSLDSDDFRKICSTSGQPYPLLSTINNVFGMIPTPSTIRPDNRTTVTPPPPPPTTTTTTLSPKTTKPSVKTTTQKVKTTTSSKKGVFSCAGKKNGFYGDPALCRAFYRCVNGVAFHYFCPGKLVYNLKYHICDWPHNVDCSRIKPPPEFSLVNTFLK